MHIDEINAQMDPEPRYKPERDIVFYLFTRENGGVPEKLLFRDQASLQQSTFRANRPTKFLVHGWQADVDSNIITGMAHAYIEIGDFNVIGCDWSAGSDTLNYISAKGRVSKNAPVIARMVDFLVENGQNMFQISCNGHSLGGQTCGVVGKNTFYGKLNTIIAMDPAGPLFSASNTNERLTPEDAEYVEVVHTTGRLGYYDPIGMVDFYPNGGESQPGCGWDLSGACAHSRSIEYVIESLYGGLFTGTKCETLKEAKKGKCSATGPYFNMGGEPTNHGTKTRGMFHFSTTSKPPFALG
jgi:hypothetical protein